MSILVVDDHPLARTGIKCILQQHSSTREIEEASSVKEAIEKIDLQMPTLIVLDLKLGEEEGLEVAEKVRKDNYGSKIIVLSSNISLVDFEKAEKLGVNAYILKEAVSEDIFYALDTIMRGKKYYDPEVIKFLKSTNSKSEKISQLSTREMDICMELEKGLSNEEIAKQLYISTNTVKKHISSILSKLSLKHRTQLALYVRSISV
jgi:DNA-binding NarL/FixJ family response regulator